jgi:putative endonuclease
MGETASYGMRTYSVYILASRSRSLYIGETNNLARRLYQHRSGQVHTTAKYRVRRLVHVETTTDVQAAIRREKQLKGWLRFRKVALIESVNPAWDDLAPE